MTTPKTNDETSENPPKKPHKEQPYKLFDNSNPHSCNYVGSCDLENKTVYDPKIPIVEFQVNTYSNWEQSENPS